jgi:MbtH protein
MSSLFDDPDILFLVVVNDEDQYSIWPQQLKVPAGWTAVHGPIERSSCIDFVNANWTDMRPRSLVKYMNQCSTTSGDSSQ